jgi:hypothetical protein
MNIPAPESSEPKWLPMGAVIPVQEVDGLIAVPGVEDEIVAALMADGHILQVALGWLDTINEGGRPDVYAWGWVLAVLEEYRLRGGDRPCPVDAPAAAVRAILADVAASMTQAAERIPDEQAGLRGQLQAGVTALRAALDGDDAG